MRPWNELPILKPKPILAKEVTPYNIADNRITIGPEVGRILIDYRVKKVSLSAFNAAYYLCERADSIVTHKELTHELWGWEDEPSKIMLGQLKSTIRQVRTTFGEELGDPKYGAIRIVRGTGYSAVTEL
jgi:DNA-binding winged helix-turn-helix (wHTH) protein